MISRERFHEVAGKVMTVVVLGAPFAETVAGAAVGVGWGNLQ
jgi:hypothetical protein